MEGQEILALEIGKARVEKMHREAALDHLATSFGHAEPIGRRLMLALPMAVGIAVALAWLVAQ